MVRSLVGKHTEYYEAILQLRNVSPDVIAFVEEEIQRVHLSVSKVLEERTGLDFYLSDNTLTRILAKKLQTTYGGEVLITATLHTQKKDKEMYRLTVLFRQAPFGKGDMVLKGGEQYRVLSMGKEMILQHTKTGKKIHARYREMKGIKKEEISFEA